MVLLQLMGLVLFMMALQQQYLFSQEELLPDLKLTAQEIV